MHKIHLCVIVAAAFLVSTASVKSQNITDGADIRAGKVFSLFSIVQFKNTGCKSQSAMTSGQSAVRNGTCYTSSECSSKGGTASGNCAAGFGVCCLFLVTTTGATINQNCTYLRNPSFPSIYSATSSLSYTVSKCSSDVCFLRLDFETFTLITPATEASCPDSFKVTTNTGTAIPALCGRNTGQHIYVDMGAASTDTATISFTFGTTASTSRTWEIKISQITCFSWSRPPTGCLQYWTTLVGRFTTFNFLSSTGPNLPSQSYSACIRRAAGYCCIQYQVCSGVTNAFTLDTIATTGMVDSNCLADHIAIPASQLHTCTSATTSTKTLYNRYCGQVLGYAAATVNGQVCDCTPPFEIFVYTNAIADAATSRGDCLDFMQIPCP